MKNEVPLVRCAIADLQPKSCDLSELLYLSIELDQAHILKWFLNQFTKQNMTFHQFRAVQCAKLSKSPKLMLKIIQNHFKWDILTIGWINWIEEDGEAS